MVIREALLNFFSSFGLRCTLSNTSVDWDVSCIDVLNLHLNAIYSNFIDFYLVGPRSSR